MNRSVDNLNNLNFENHFDHMVLDMIRDYFQFSTASNNFPQTYNLIINRMNELGYSEHDYGRNMMFLSKVLHLTAATGFEMLTAFDLSLGKDNVLEPNKLLGLGVYICTVLKKNYDFKLELMQRMYGIPNLPEANYENILEGWKMVDVDEMYEYLFQSSSGGKVDIQNVSILLDNVAKIYPSKYLDAPLVSKIRDCIFNHLAQNSMNVDTYGEDIQLIFLRSLGITKPLNLQDGLNKFWTGYYVVKNGGDIDIKQDIKHLRYNQGLPLVQIDIEQINNFIHGLGIFQFDHLDRIDSVTKFSDIMNFFGDIDRRTLIQMKHSIIDLFGKDTFDLIESKI